MGATRNAAMNLSTEDDEARSRQQKQYHEHATGSEIVEFAEQAHSRLGANRQRWPTDQE
jgi:hypothetical protein